MQSLRFLTAGAGAFALAAALTTSLALPQAAKAEGDLHLFNWSNYFPPELMEKFEKDTGISVSLDTYASDEDMLAKIQAGGGGYDIVFPSGSTVTVMISQGLAEKIDASTLPNFKNVMAPHDAPTTDPKREYSIPYMWGTTGVSYDSEKLGTLPESWEWYFKPTEEIAQAGLASLNDMRDVYYAAAYYLGVDKCTDNAEEAQQILDLLLGQKPHLKLYSSEGTIDRMIAGEVAVHMQWNGAAHRVKEERPSVVYVYPEEGATFWSDSMMVPAGAPNKENAKTFLNWMMEPENAAIASNYTGYMNAIKGSSEHLEESLKNDPAVNMPEEYAERLRPFKECNEKAVELRDRVWTRLKG
ncbi:MAG: extracellular solute-binding protein [Tistlia sp.]|uniref:extracellular solute-binding protein n=1 Tax=Tistlia sp. TaxID=3057121 RepID=UPI0034A41F55